MRPRVILVEIPMMRQGNQRDNEFKQGFIERNSLRIRRIREASVNICLLNRYLLRENQRSSIRSFVRNWDHCLRQI